MERLRVCFGRWSIIIFFLVILFFLYAIRYTLYAIPIYAQTCTSSQNNEGLISANSTIQGGGSFGNKDITCVFDPKAAYRDFKIPSYDDLENQFYALSRSSYKMTDPLSSPDFRYNIDGNGIYRQPATMTVNSFDGSGIKVIFVRGDLNITGNINYAENDPYSGLVFIVSGNINIYAYDRNNAVTKINAVLISSGTICTAYFSASSTCSTGNAATPQLVVNGGLISIYKPNPLTSPNPSPRLLLRRNLADNTTQASEIVNKLAKYLYILKGGILTKDLIITQEDSNYVVPTPPGGPSPPPPPPPLPPCQLSNPLSIGTNIQAVPPLPADCIIAI